MEIVNVTYRGTGVEYQGYSQKDLDLITSNVIYTQFGESNDRVEYHIYDENGILLESIYNASEYYPNNPNSVSNLFNEITLEPKRDLTSLGYNRGVLNIQYNFLKNLFNSSELSKYWIKEISLSRTEIKLSSQVLSDDAINSGFINYQQYLENKNYYSDFYLNFEQNKLVICTNVAYLEDDEGAYLLIKLYEPLPLEFETKTQLWIVDKIAESVSYDVNTQIESTPIQRRNSLRGPNFKIAIDKRVGQTTPYYTYSSLMSSSLSGSQQKLSSYYDDKAKQINLDFSYFSNFIHFSSANSRLYNFYYKIGLVETYQSGIAQQSFISGSTTIISSSINVLQSNIDSIISKFDIWEYAMYFQSESWAYPKLNSTQPYSLYSTASIQTQNWFASQSYSASIYDELNSNRLSYAIPQYILEDSTNTPYITFVDMVGQHFDNIWVYYKDVTNRFNATNDPNTGISPDIVADALRGLGTNLYTNTSISDNIYYSLFGINADGSLLPPTGSEIITNYITSSIQTLSSNDLEKEIYKRLYHNLPYLLKTKGTRRGIQAIINSFGIPEEILTVNEFGGTNSRTTSGIFEINNNKINVFTSSLSLSSSLLSPYSTLQYFDTSNRVNVPSIEVGFSPSDKINENISQSVGYFDIDQLIGEFGNQYSSSYPALDRFRNNYFQTYTQTHSLYEYIRVIKYYNNSLFKMIRDWVPARSDLSTGLIIKPHILERSKYARHEPVFSVQLDYSHSIDPISISGDPGTYISGSTEWSGYISSSLGIIPFTSSQGVEKVTGEFGGTVLTVTNGYSQSQADVFSNPSGSEVAAIDRGALYQNVTSSLRSIRFFDLDYTSNQLNPVNLNLVTYSINESQANNWATYTNPISPYSYVQDYGYNTHAWKISRYSGSRNESKLYSTWSVGDSSYGKTAAIDKLKYQYAYLIDIYTSSMFFPDRSNAQIKYLIDSNQNILDLTKKNENIFTIQNIFKSSETTDVSLFQYDEDNPYSQKLVNNQRLNVYEGGFRYLPILHNLSGSATVQTYTLTNPDFRTINISTTVPNIDPNSPEFDISNWQLYWYANEIPLGNGNSNYSLIVSASYIPGNVSFDVSLNIRTSRIPSLGYCEYYTSTTSYPVTVNITSGNKNGQFEYTTLGALPSTGNPGGTSAYLGANWPYPGFEYPYCNLWIDGIMQTNGGSGTTVVTQETYYTTTVSSSQTCLYYLTGSNEVVFNPTLAYYFDQGLTFNSTSDPSYTNKLDTVILPFTINRGDRISFYNSSSGIGWNERFEYTVKSVYTSGSSNPSGSILIAELDRSLNLSLLTSASVTPEPFTKSTHRSCRYIVWKHVPDETNVILKYNPKDPTLIETGILFPQYIEDSVRKNAGNTIKSLRAQNLLPPQ